MLRLFSSNRTEKLAARLIQRIASAPAGVFEPVEIVVPSAGMRRYLTLAVADGNGICANVRFDFLATWLWRLIRGVIPTVAEESPFAAPVLAWRILRAFGDAAFVGTQPRLHDYLAGADPVMRYELAARTAGLFEQYTTYRPDWLAAWRGGRALPPDALPVAAREDELWQAALWRWLVADLGVAATHPAEAFIEALHRGRAPAGGAVTPHRERAPAGEPLTAHRGSSSAGEPLTTHGGSALTHEPRALPSRAHLFALPAMPPLHMELLVQLGRSMDIDCYVLDPCEAYWHEVVTPRELARLAARDAVELHETGNRLLANWGRQTQALVTGLARAADAVTGLDTVIDDADFVPNPAMTVLACLQNAILALEELEPRSLQLADDDRSLELHVCHSLTRELEVLQDRLLGLFAANDGLRPADVLVAVPDIDAAAPLIEAVFGTVPDTRRIPFTITGRAATQASGPARTLVELLALAGSRVTASALFALLQIPVVSARFGLDEDAVDQLHQWLDAAGFRWGLDAAHRSSFGVPAQAQHTLSDALDRLFLGYALPDGSTVPFGGRVPIGGAEGTAALALGALAQFAERLRRLQRDLSSPQSPQQWAVICNRALDDFVAVDTGGQAALRAVRQAIATVTRTLHDAAFDAPLPFAIYRTALAEALDPAAPGGIPTGAVTFASMRALRGVPFAVVCCLGLDDGAYPSPARPAEFDLMALAPRFGDRLRRDDDRNGLLDLLLAARSIVHLSHSGRSIRDNAPLPPSVLVSELIDTVTAAIDDDPVTARARLVVTHPLQSFSPSIFRPDGDGDPRRRSHDRELAEALAASAAHGAAKRGKAGATAGRVEPADKTGAAVGSDAPAGKAGTRSADSTAGDSVPEEPGGGAAQPGAGTETTDETAEVEEGDDPRMLPLFVAGPLPLADETRRDVSVEQLSRFFRKPARYFVRQRLGIDLGREGAELVDDEAFLPDWSGRTALAERLLPDCLEGLGGEALRRRALAGNEWPSGAIGAATIARELATLERFAAEIRRHAGSPTLASHLAEVTIEVDGETWRVHGQFDDLRAAGLVRWRYDEVRAADLLDIWIPHLLLAAGGTEVHATRWILRQECLLLRPPADARALLADLVALYRDGLREPSPFHPKAAWTLVGLEEKLPSVRGRWLPLPHRTYAEGNDAAVRLVGRGRIQDLEPTFEDVARCVFEPLIAHREVVALGGGDSDDGDGNADGGDRCDSHGASVADDSPGPGRAAADDSPCPGRAVAAGRPGDAGRAVAPGRPVGPPRRR